MLANIVNQFVLHHHARLPDFFVGHVIDSLPNLGVGLVVEEVLIKMRSIEMFPLRSAPSGEVYTVGNVAHMAFFGEVTLPDGSEHLLGNLSVQPAHTVHLLRSIASEYRHTETFTLVARIVTSEVHQVVPADTHS